MLLIYELFASVLDILKHTISLSRNLTIEYTYLIAVRIADLSFVNCLSSVFDI